MPVYSHNGAVPAPLPHRIRIPDGSGFRTRTDASTFTETEIEAAGYVLADAQPAPVGGIKARWDGEAWQSAPSYTPATHHAPVWDGSSWDAAVAKNSGDLAADLAARKAAMFEQCRLRFRAVRDAGTSIDFGGGPVAVQTTPEAANDVARLHDDLVFQAVNGVSDPTQAIATSEYVVVPAVTIAMAAAMREAVAAHWRATWACDAAVGAAIVVAADHAALDLIDVAAGTVDGVGGWPT
jgi:hypothetical protein